MDMWFVKGLLNDDAMIGYYSASYNLSRPLFLLMGGVMVVMFPSYSKAVSENNTLLLQKYIRQAMRFSLVILLPVVVMLGSTSDELITLLFTKEYLPASNSLRILLFGIAIFSIFALFLNLIAAKNKPFYSFIISLALVPVAIVLNYFLINSQPQA
jgi:stage V sporulation protein B